MRTLALLLVSVLGACGASDGKNGGTTADGGIRSDMGAASDGGIPCSTLVTLSASSAFAPSTLVAVAHVQTGATPSWTIGGPDGDVTPTYLDSGHFSVSIDAPSPGTYTFLLALSEGCPGFASTVVMAPGGIVQPYRLRLTPPATSGLPQQDAIVNTFGNTPQLVADVTLLPGSALVGTLRGTAGAVAGQVVLQPQSGPPVLAQVGPSGAFSIPIRLDGMYQLSLLPLDAGLAPRIFGPIDGATLQAQVQSATLGAGVTVTGVVRDPALQPLAGAKVVLRRGALTSGVGVASSDGSYAVHAEPGLYDLAVSAPGWPGVTLGGIDVATGSTLGVDLTMTRAAVTLHVVAADGTTPIGGAKVTVTSSSLPNAAIVHTTSGDRAATGRVHLDAVAAADGTLTLLLAPAGYDVLVDAGGVLTGRHLVIAGPSAPTVSAAASVTLAGLVSDESGAAVVGARVRARPGSGPALETSTGSDGRYSLAGVPSGLAVTLEVVPPPGKLASAQRALGVASQLGGTLPSMADVTLPRGLTFAGFVRSPSGSALPGVSIDVLCVSCGDATPLAHTDSSSGGGYTLYLPDPGVVDVDGGSDSGAP